LQTGDVDFNASSAGIRQILLRTFSAEYSKALQQTLVQMREAVIDQHAFVDEIKFSCPNKHHFVVDLSFRGLDNAVRCSTPPTVPTASSRRPSPAPAPPPPRRPGSVSLDSAEENP